MPELAEHPLHPERPRLVRHDRDHPRARAPCPAAARRGSRTNAIVVEISRSPVPSSCDSKISSGGTASGCSTFRRRAGQVPAERLAALAHVGHLRRVVGRLVEGDLVDLLVGDLELEAVAEDPQRVLVHLLLLVRDVLALAGLAHPVALDGLREDDGRAARRALGRGVGRVDLLGVVPAAVQVPDLLVGHVLDAVGQLRVLPEEVLAHVGAVARLVDLVLAVDRLLHALDEQAVVVGLQQRVPAVAPDHLDARSSPRRGRSSRAPG